MNNVLTKIVGDKLIIEIDVSQQTIDAARPSGSGKTLAVASTGGFVPIGPGKLSLNYNMPLNR
jgi:hypothetical protein